MTASAMIRVNVAPGPFKSERSVSFEAEGQTHALIVDEQAVCGDRLAVQVVGDADDGHIWVQLPRDSLRGQQVKVPRTMVTVNPQAIRVVSTSSATTDWRATRADGTYLCDIRLDLFVNCQGSRYFIVKEGSLVKEGTFSCTDWDDETAREVLTLIMVKMCPGAEVHVGARRPSQAR